MAAKTTQKLPTTCHEAARCFRAWARDTVYAEDAATYKARAETLEAFEDDTPVPQMLLDTWNFDLNKI